MRGTFLLSFQALGEEQQRQQVQTIVGDYIDEIMGRPEFADAVEETNCSRFRMRGHEVTDFGLGEGCVAATVTYSASGEEAEPSAETTVRGGLTMLIYSWQHVEIEDLTADVDSDGVEADEGRIRS